MDLSWAIGGVSDKIPRTAGLECSNFLTTHRKVLESIIIIGLCLWLIKWSVQKLQQPIQNQQYSIDSSTLSSTSGASAYQQHSYYHQIPRKIYDTQQQQQPTSIQHNTLQQTTTLGKQILLITITLVFGVEIGFKLASKTLIYILNPCHITTIIQIYLLAAKPSERNTILFRIHLNFLNGPLLAFLFPEVESRQLPLEQTTYWIQHGLMVIIPIYLLRIDRAYTMEPITDFRWNVIGYCIMIVYHFAVLQFVSSLTGVNLNYMICPSLSDPFDGSNYRIAATIHQAFLCPILCKLFCLIFSPSTTITKPQVDIKVIANNSETIYSDYDTLQQLKQHHHYAQSHYDNVLGVSLTPKKSSISSQGSGSMKSQKISQTPPPPPQISIIEDPIMTTKID